MSVRTYIEIAAGIFLAIAFGLYTYHERSVGETKVHTADAKALQAERAKVDAQSSLNLERATKADLGAINEQKTIDAYVAAHPEQPVRLCHAAYDRRPVLPAGGAKDSSAPSAGPGSTPVRAVQDGTPGPDIGPGLDELVQSSARLATLYSDQQQR